MNNKPTIITFSGKARNGKDGSAEILKAQLEKRSKRVLHINYADYVKFTAEKYFGWNGVKDEAGRTLLQQHGTEKVRTKYPDFWVDTVIRMVDVFCDDFDYVVIGDCRFDNEVYRWDRCGYRVVPVHVKRRDFENDLTEEQRNHPSETAMDDFYFSTYISARDLNELEREVIDKIIPLLET